MKTKDFEYAINALSDNIFIDEIKLRHSHVRQVNAHTDELLIVWDEHGRAFSVNKNEDSQIFLYDDGEWKIKGERGIQLSRDKSFDLTFK